LYQAASLVEAQLLVEELARYGIRTYVRNEALQGALGELPLSLRPEVCIMDARDVERASVVLSEFCSTASDAPGLLVCELCHEESPANFELCWKCRRPIGESEVTEPSPH
jgi:hypothetical protein